MKNKLLILSLLLAIFSACNKDSITANDKQVGESTVTYYVVMTLKGPDVMSVVKGTPFTDPGAEATENGVPVTYTTSGSVDVSTPGLYVLNLCVRKSGWIFVICFKNGRCYRICPNTRCRHLRHL